MIMENFGGEFPSCREDVLKLKGIGPYTVASFLALAFNQSETVIDGNVMRVICRLYHLTRPLDEIGEDIRNKATALTDKENPADYASAIMDLGGRWSVRRKSRNACFAHGRKAVSLKTALSWKIFLCVKNRRKK